MTEQQGNTSANDKREEARERIEDMPAETALGNRDPEGGGKGQPSDYEKKDSGR